MSIDPKTVYGVFLDNDQGHLERMKATYEKMLMIRIPDSGLAPQVSFEGTGGFAKFVESELAAGNLYCAGLQLLGRDGDSYDKLSGIQEHHITKLYELLSLLRTSSPGPLYVLLDWDRTMTVVEGYIGVDYICGSLPGAVDRLITEKILPVDTEFGIITEEKKSQMYEDQLRYLLGGPKRLAMIREMLETLSTFKNTHVWILTNNTGCDSDSFWTMVAHLSPHIKHIICAWFTSGGNKTSALTSELVQIRSESSSNSASASASSYGTSYGGSKKTRRRHGPGHSHTRGRYHLRKSKKKKKVTTIRR
jgi:hypothetical protein